MLEQSESSPRDQAKNLERQNQHLKEELATCLPFCKVAPGQYLIGTEIRKIQIKGRGVLVKTGNAFMYMSEHLLHFAKSEGIQLALMLLK